MLQVIEWRDDPAQDGAAVVLIDQRRLPMVEEYVTCRDVETVAAAIETMVVRGAPAIGVTAAMGLALAARLSEAGDGAALLTELEAARERLFATRPTAVNLRWALDRVMAVARDSAGEDAAKVRSAVLAEALAMHREDIETNRAIGHHGAALLGDGDAVLTHCNAGALATAGYGTALGVIRAAVETGKKIAVYADETRPFLQGARLTAWELRNDNIPVTVITDGMAGSVLRSGRVQAVVVGADRIAANGDTANKIGTYPVAVLARENQVPFYVAAPLSTVDFETATGDDIPIEERAPEEVTRILDVPVVPLGVAVYNPAFDVTPARYVAAIITERGVAKPPFTESLQELRAAAPPATS